eukprot:sb/3472753/
MQSFLLQTVFKIQCCSSADFLSHSILLYLCLSFSLSLYLSLSLSLYPSISLSHSAVARENIKPRDTEIERGVISFLRSTAEIRLHDLSTQLDIIECLVSSHFITPSPRLTTQYQSFSIRVSGGVPTYFFVFFCTFLYGPYTKMPKILVFFRQKIQKNTKKS